MAASSAIRGRSSSRSRSSAATSATTAPSRRTRAPATAPISRRRRCWRSPAPAPPPAAPRRCSPWATSRNCAGARRGRRWRRWGTRRRSRTCAAMCALVLKETGLLPHANPGVMNRDEIAALRAVTASQGIMLESASARLCEPGQVHHGSPDKHPEARLEVLRLAGELRVPFTTGILIGIGETRAERLEALRRSPRSHARTRPYPGSHHPEFPRQAAHQAGRGGGAGPRRPALDHRRGAAGAGRGDAHPGAAEPVARRLPAAGRGRAGRLGRRLPGDARPREPGSALAASGRPGRPHRGGRQGAGAAAADLCRICPRAGHLVRARGRHRDAPRQRCRRLRPRR